MFKQEGKKRKSLGNLQSLAIDYQCQILIIKRKMVLLHQTLSMRLLLAMNAGFWNTVSKIILLVRIGYSAAQKIVVFGVMRFVEKREVFLTTESFFVQNARKNAIDYPIVWSIPTL
jgi:hypothetical protein